MLFRSRQPRKDDKEAPSRGAIVPLWLKGHKVMHELWPQLAMLGYNGFNLLASDLHDLWWYSNRSKSRQPQKLKPGLYGLSNALLDTPWPKVRSRVGALCEVLAADRGQFGSDSEPYLQLLADEKQAPDWELPSTGEIGRAHV